MVWDSVDEIEECWRAANGEAVTIIDAPDYSNVKCAD
jgi:hypothetical protein